MGSPIQMGDKNSNTNDSDVFYLKYYTGHSGKFGQEFLEFELYEDGLLRYANNSNYKNDNMIRKEVYLSNQSVKVFKYLVEDSEITKESDSRWPKPDRVGSQELNLIIGNKKYSFLTAKICSLNEISIAEDPDGLRAFYYLAQDLRAYVFSLISLHFKIKPF